MIRRHKTKKESNIKTYSPKFRKYFIIIVILILLFFFCTFFTIIIFEKTKILGVKTLNAYIEVNSDFRGGLNVDNETINFGSIYAGGQSKRWIHISFPQDSVVAFKSYGSISKYIFLDENDIFISANQTKKIVFTAIIPEDTKPGNYEGLIRIYFKKP